MFIIKNRNVFFTISGVLLTLGVVSLIVFSPWNYGIEFTGGSLLEVSYPNGRPDIESIREKLDALNWTGTMVQPTGDSNYIIRTKDLSKEERQELIDVVSNNGTLLIEENRFSSKVHSW